MRIRSLAVLSIAAVSFLIGCNNDADNKFIDQANKAIESEKNNITTPSSAVTIAYDKGVDINGYTLKKTSNNIAFDIDTKQFTIMNGDNVTYAPKGYKKNSNTYHIFKFSNVYDSRSTYSQYLTRNFAGSDLLVVTTGLDMGENNNVKNITYFNSTDTAKDILLNVSCDYLNISTTKDNIYHYGSSNNVFIPSTLSGSYHEYGSCCYIQAAGGNVFLENGSYSDLFEVPSGSSVNIKQSEGSDILMRVNANVRAQSTAKIKEISNSSATADEIQGYLNDTQYNFYRLTTEARDIKLDNAYLEFKRNVFFDLNGRSITFGHGADVKIQKQTTGEEKDKYETYKTAILVKGDGTQDLSAFLFDTQSTLYHRSGINLLDCSIVVEGVNETTATNFYINSGKIHDVRATDGSDPKNVNKPAVVLVGNILQDNKDRKPKNCTLNMYGGYIKTEKGVNWSSFTGAHKCLQPRGLGCTLNMIYGDLESFHYCISGQGTATNNNLDVDKYGETIINITGGNITGGTEDPNYPALFFPQSGTVNITGGKITGPSCIDAKAGNINISGAQFTATRSPYNEDAEAGENGAACDGSVIFMESARCYHGAVLNPLNIYVEYSTMTSKTGHIVKASGYKRKTETEYAGLTITFKDGTFTYKKDDPIACEEKIKDVFTSSVEGGTWTKAE